MAPRDGLEPPTQWLTATCSTAELPGNNGPYNKLLFKEPVLFLEAETGIEPVYKDLQSSASPLCHPATIKIYTFFKDFGQERSR
jgi:hypothetical protein